MTVAVPMDASYDDVMAIITELTVFAATKLRAAQPAANEAPPAAPPCRRRLPWLLRDDMKASALRVGAFPLVRIRSYTGQDGFLHFVSEYAEGPDTGKPAFPPPTWEECERVAPEGWKLIEEGGSIKGFPRLPPTG